MITTQSNEQDNNVPTEDKFSSLRRNAYKEYQQESITSPTAQNGIYFLIKKYISYRDEKENGFMANSDTLTEIMCCSKH